MTSTPESADDGQNPPEQPVPPSDPSATPSPSDPAAAEASVAGNPQEEVDEGLPEWEPLTPELVEDEAIRGDFVIRWAVVGLALLFGFSQIDETRTLVHVRTGEYLASHGFLPPAVDVFSYTAGDRRWVNLSWLFDLSVAAVHQIGGGIGLSILQGVLAGVAFGLLAHTYRSGIRTWWGSICAILALLACYSQLTVQPELITLLGLAGLLWIVVQSDEPGSAIHPWMSVPVVWLWSQLDQRAFLGWLLLIAIAAGSALRRGSDVSHRRESWLRVAGLSVLVVVIHPFLWEAWLAPIRLYASDYPALRQIFLRPIRHELAFYGINSLVWSNVNHDMIAALVLFASTIIALVLNRDNLNLGHVLAVVLFNSLACVTTHEIAAASLVNCVICTVNAQTWYRNRFGQVYSIDWRELLFSRGGRAVTVFCLFALAWTVISGRIDGPSGKRTSIGFHDHLRVQMDSYREIAERSLDDRPFHFSPRQGDLLIWAGQKSFIDTRASLFAGTREQDLLALQDRTRKALRAVHDRQEQTTQNPVERTASSDPGVWKATFEKYQITHVIPRLSGPVPSPDYITFGDLITNSDFVVTDVLASAAVFYRNSKEGPLGEFVKSHELDAVKAAFRLVEPKPVATRVDGILEFARPATTYDNLFSLRQPKSPAGVQEANHYLQLTGLSGAQLSVRAACGILATRRAMGGLREDPNSPDGYRILGLSHLVLDQIEALVMKEVSPKWFDSTQYLQAVTALQQSAQLRPDEMTIHSDLYNLYKRTGRGDMALESIRQIKRLRPAILTAEQRKQWEPLINEEFAIVEAMAKVEEAVNKQLEAGEDRFQVASLANRAGALRTAIRILEEEAIYKEQNPAAKAALGMWMLEAGRTRDGLEALEAVEQISTIGGGAPGWRDSVAMGMLVIGDYEHAIRLWNEQLREDASTSATSVLMTLPFQGMNPMSDQYPFAHVGAIIDTLGRGRGDAIAVLFKIAKTQLELGDNAGATSSFQRMLTLAPQSGLLPLIKFYLQNLTKKEPDVPSQTESILIEELEVFGEEPLPEKKPAESEKAIRESPK